MNHKDSSSSSSSSSSSDSSSSSSSSSSDDSVADAAQDAATQAAGALIFYALAVPWTVPHLAAEPDGWTSATYERYPYADGARSAVRIGPSDEAIENGAIAPPRARDVALQLTADESYLVTNLWRTSIAGRLQLPGRMELDSTWSIYFEPIQGGTTDVAAMGTTHAAFRFAQSEAVQLRTGLGLRTWTGPDGTKTGFDASYGFDIYWARPLLTSVTLDFGNLGSAFVFQVRGTIGVTLDRVELFGGYDHVAMKNLDDSRLGVGLGGPVVGARFWF
jgi:hypothetical protein